MKMLDEISEMMLAPCGIDCGVCSVHLRPKKSCPGCRGSDAAKPGHCLTCRIKSCATSRGLPWCVECPEFPCVVIQRIDKSYRLRYQVSLVANARRLKEVGAPQYLVEEKERWTCPACGGVISVHTRVCSDCGRATQPS